MSRSLIFAFLCALILHLGVALMDLSAFKRPYSLTIVPKPLTMNFVVPQPVEKLLENKEKSIPVNKPIEKREVSKKATPKKEVKKIVARKKGIQSERPVVQERLTEKEKTLSYLPPPENPNINKVDTSEHDIVFKPDMVNIPQALPNKKDTPKVVKKDAASDLSSHIPITYAHPIYKRNISPSYPLLARKRGYQGTVLLAVLVSKDGKAATVQLAKSSGYTILDRAAIKEVEKWLFYPAMRGDELCEMWVTIPIRFTLN